MTGLWVVGAVVAAILFPGGAVASESWSVPEIVAHGAQLAATASDQDGQVAAVLDVQGGPKDFGGVSSSVGLSAIVADDDGVVSPPMLLSSSPLANDPGVALADNHPVAAWLDLGSSDSSQGELWVWDSWSSSAPVVPLSGDAYGAPAVATDDRGDVVVAWVDASSHEVMAASSAGGGGFGAPVVVSPQESTEDSSDNSPVATIDPQGTATIAWQADAARGFEPAGTPGPPGVVMAASAGPGEPFAAPEAALTGAGGTLVQGLAIQSDANGQVLVSATLAAPPSWTDPSGSPAINFAIASPGGAFSPQGQLATTPSGVDPTGWAIAPDGSVLATTAAQTTSGGQLSTTEIATNGTTSTQNPFQVAVTPGQLGSVWRIVPGFDSGGDAIVLFTAGETMHPGSFGNPSAGSILSVTEPSGSGAWCAAQLVSGLMSPFFPIGVAYDTAGHGIVLYQQNPWGDIAASYLTPYQGCPPTTASIPLIIATVARAGRALHFASIASHCTVIHECLGKLVLLNRASRTLASGTVVRSNSSSTTIQVRLTSLGRNTLRHHNHVHTRAELITGQSKLALPPVTLTRR